MNQVLAKMLLNFFLYFRLRELNGGTLRGIIFQQDGAPAHTARLTIQYLQDLLLAEEAGVEGPLPHDLSETAFRTVTLLETELTRLGMNPRLNPIRLISIGGDVEWSPRSPDLTPMDFWLWGVLKHRCFLTPPANADELLRRITDECRRMEREEVFTFEHVR